ncbi:MAG: MBL fold metallo-hydrolase [Candidatus Shapirobacteria bacterium]
MLKYKILVLGDLDTNCYLVWDEESRDAFVIDPADDGVYISEEINQNNLNLIGILLTHGHFDHTLGALDLKLIFDVPLYCSDLDFFLLGRQNKTATHFLKHKVKVPDFKKVDVDLDKTNKIKLGSEVLEVIKSPGHTPGSVCFYSKQQKLLFSGDTLFAGLRGRTDFSYGSTEDIFKSIKKLVKLPEETIVLSGHGEETTIEKEAKRYF